MFFYVGVLYDVIVGRVQALREEPKKDLGASALEWAIIAAVSVVMATIIGTVIYNIVQTKSSAIKNCGDQGPGGTC
jgi:hypothetical protein